MQCCLPVACVMKMRCFICEFEKCALSYDFCQQVLIQSSSLETENKTQVDNLRLNSYETELFGNTLEVDLVPSFCFRKAWTECRSWTSLISEMWHILVGKCIPGPPCPIGSFATCSFTFINSNCRHFGCPTIYQDSYSQCYFIH